VYEPLLVLRAHWLRLSLRLMVPHLLNKAFGRRPEAEQP
jgi:hypothetical protein